MRSLKVLLPIAVIAVLAGGVSPAATPSLRIRSGVGRAPNDLGWYRDSITYRLLGLGSRTTVVSCGRSSIEQRADGTGLGFATLTRVPLSRCRMSGSVSVTSVTTLGLSIEAPDGRSASRAITLRLDRDAPAITADAPSIPISVSPVHLEGTASDGFSGVRHVMLEFADALGQQEISPTAASCSDCAKALPCSRRSDGRSQCGSSVTWAFDGEMPPGLWSITPVAADLAGNDIRGDPVQVLVVAF